MKKRAKKLQLHRDTVRALDPFVGQLVEVAAAGPHTSEGRPCCATDVDPYTRPVKEKTYAIQQ